jgi:hypothetical protein
LIDRALQDLPRLQVQGHGVGIGLTLDLSGRTKRRANRDLLLYPFHAQQRRVNWVCFVENGGHGFIRAFMVKVKTVWISLVKFVY